MKNKIQKGFTLVEIIVALAIIGTLVLIATSNNKDTLLAANETQIKADITTVKSSLGTEKLQDESGGGLNTEKEYKSVELTEDELKDLTVYDKTGKEINLPKDKYYKVDIKKLGVESSLKGTFIADANNKVYYASTTLAGKDRTDYTSGTSTTVALNTEEVKNGASAEWVSAGLPQKVTINIPYNASEETIKSQIKFELSNKIPSDLDAEIKDLINGFIVDSISGIDAHRSLYTGIGSAVIKFKDDTTLDISVKYTVGESLANQDRIYSFPVVIPYNDKDPEPKIKDETKKNSRNSMTIEIKNHNIDTKKENSIQKVKVKVIYTDYSENTKIATVIIDESLASKDKNTKFRKDFTYNESNANDKAKNTVKDNTPGVKEVTVKNGNIDTKKAKSESTLTYKVTYTDESTKEKELYAKVGDSLANQDTKTHFTKEFKYNEAKADEQAKKIIETNSKGVSKVEVISGSINTRKANSETTIKYKVTYTDSSTKEKELVAKVGESMANQDKNTTIKVTFTATEYTKTVSEKKTIVDGKIKDNTPNYKSTTDDDKIKQLIQSTNRGQTKSQSIIVEYKDGSTKQKTLTIEVKSGLNLECPNVSVQVTVNYNASQSTVESAIKSEINKKLEGTKFKPVKITGIDVVNTKISKTHSPDEVTLHFTDNTTKTATATVTVRQSMASQANLRATSDPLTNLEEGTSTSYYNRESTLWAYTTGNKNNVTNYTRATSFYDPARNPGRTDYAKLKVTFKDGSETTVTYHIRVKEKRRTIADNYSRYSGDTVITLRGDSDFVSVTDAEEGIRSSIENNWRDGRQWRASISVYGISKSDISSVRVGSCTRKTKDRNDYTYMYNSWGSVKGYMTTYEYPLTVTFRDGSTGHYRCEGKMYIDRKAR